nr:aldolase/citrate lyase family protein [Nocardia vaccinii]
MQDSLRAALRSDGQILCLALTHSRTPDVPAIAAACGYDAVYVDLEHTTVALETAAMLCAAAVGAGIFALVRVPSQEPSLITRILDAGAAGVIVPHVDSAEEARAVVLASRFPPVGQRSVAGPNPVSGYQPRTPAELITVIEERTAVVVMVETPAAVAAADVIAGVQGLDMIVVGPHDLTAAMGIYGQFENDAFRAAVRTVADACQAHGVAFGIAGIKSLDHLRWLTDMGLRFISAGTDIGMLTEAATARAKDLRGLSHRRAPEEPTHEDTSKEN